MSRPHKHDWSGLWSHWGPYGRQDAHVHDCADRRCKWFLQGEGRACSEASAHLIVEGVEEESK